MTEAAHQMASNPLPPRRAQAGLASASRPGPEVAIMDDDGELLPRRRDRRDRDPRAATSPRATRTTRRPTPRPSPTAGSAPATRACMDDDGYLRITGRLKEIINRGGEKISPREVDEVLMDHPAVAQVVTFAMPHDKLGEEVAAAVVLREGMRGDRARAPRLRRRRGSPTSRCRARSCSSTEIPKGATGKLQRIGLAAEARARRDEDLRSSAPARSAGCSAPSSPQAGASTCR